MYEYMAVLQKFADFNGRSRRREYWMFMLVNCGILFAFGILAMLVAPLAGSKGSVAVLLLGAAYLLATVIPFFAVRVRRLHDTGKSGWWMLLGFVPVGGLVLLVFMLQDGDAHPNEYGSSPKLTPVSA